jgi:hypothetical protein
MLGYIMPLKMKKYSQKAKILGLLFLTLSLIVTLSLSAHSGLASAQKRH